MHLNKWFALSLSMFLFISIVSCTQEIQERETVERNGLLYKMGEDNPFTGIVLGRGREDYRREAYDFRKAYKKGVQDGETVFLYPNGKLESKVPYKNGQVSGFMFRYWPNGRPKARIHFVDGFRGGAKGEMFWDEDGHQINS
jgi:antitoxin component YwqK of YwqJK toxin-antitoxin module